LEVASHFPEDSNSRVLFQRTRVHYVSLTWSRK